MSSVERLRLTRISKIANESPVLSHASLTVFKGEVVGIYYTHTAQKEALVDILSGSESFDSGQVFWNEVLIPGHRLRMTREIAIINNIPSLVESADIADNIFVIRNHSEMGGFAWLKTLRAETIRKLNTFGLGHLSATTLVDKLTLGERKLIEMLRAVLYGASQLVIDDVLGTLDINDLRLVSRTLKLFASQGISILIFDTNLDVLGILADRIIILDHSRLLSFSHNSLSRASSLHRDLSHLPSGADSQSLPAHDVAPTTDAKLPLPSSNGMLIEVCDAKYTCTELYQRLLASNPQLTNTPRHSGVFQPRTSRYIQRYVDLDIRAHLLSELSPKENLILPACSRLTHGLFLSRRRIDVLCDDFNRWYGNSKCLEAEHIYDLSLKDQLALLLYRFRVEGIRVLFCPDPRMGFDVKTALHILDLLRSLVKKLGLDVCILSRNAKEHIADCDQLIFFNEEMSIETTLLNTFTDYMT